MRAGYPIKLNKTEQQLVCQLDSNFKSPKENNCQTKISVSPKQVPNSCVKKSIMQCANSATFSLWMVNFKKLKNMYLFLPKFTAEISYQLIEIKENKLAYVCDYRF